MAGRNTEYKMAIRIAGEIDKTFPKSMQLSKAELRAIAKEAAQAEKEFSRTSKQMGKGFFDASALKETKGFFTAIEKAGVKAFKTVGKVAGTTGAAIGAFSVKTGMDYEKQMSTVKAISKASESDFKIMQEEAKRIGSTTAATAKEAGQAMEYEAMAGWKADQIVAATSAIVDLKQSSEDLDLATTSDILTDAITAFGMKAEDATHMADVMASASTNANTDVAMLGESFKYAAPMAGSMGYSVEDAALTLGLMANSGIKSSMAGTTERNWIKRMVKPTKESEAAMKDLGLSTKDKNGKSKSLLQITEDTRKAFSKIKDKDEKSKYAAMLAGSQGMNGLLAVANASEKDFNSLKNAIYDCDGAAKELANTKLDNLEGDVTLFTSAVQGAGVDIYEEIKEPLRDLVQGATEWVGDFSEGFKTEFPTIVREVKQAGEAIGDFAEPLLEVGGWMLDNPDVIAGAIGGIGAAVGTHKVVDGVTDLAGGISDFVDNLGEFKTNSLPVLALAGVAGVIAGVGTAVAISNEQVKEASLDKHFGDIALSMDEVQRVAKEIVGAKKLEKVGELFESMESVEAAAKAMESAKKEFNTIEWKLSAGLKVTKSDKKDFETSVKQYVDQAQEVIEQKGYEVKVATELLFGDSENGAELIKDNNAFYAALDEETSELSKKINKKLKKAVKNGLSLDLEEEINSLLGDLSEITNAVTNAENEASWNTLKTKWSGKELDSDSFKNIVEESKGKLEELKNGALEAHEKVEANLGAQHELGYISDKEFASKKELNDKEYQATIQESKNDAIEFLYNTMMDTYGQTIANGKYEDGDKNAIKEMISYIKEFEPDSKMSNDLNSIILAMNQNALTDFNSWLGNVSGNTDKDVYAIADKESKKIAQDYLQNREQEMLPEINIDNVISTAQQVLDSNPFNFTNCLEIPAQEAGKSASENVKDGIKANMATGVTAQLPMTLYGNYSMTGVLTPAEQKETEKPSAKKEAKNVIKAIKAEPYAKGGIATEPTLLVAEAGVSESVIPLDGSAHSIDLWNQTGRLLGVADKGKRAKPFSEVLAELSRAMDKGKSTSVENTSGSPIYITFSPNITVQGNADEAVVNKAVGIGYEQFKKMMDRYNKTQRRVSLKGGG